MTLDRIKEAAGLALMGGVMVFVFGCGAFVVWGTQVLLSQVGLWWILPSVAAVFVASTGIIYARIAHLDRQDKRR